MTQSWEEILEKVSPTGYIFTKRVLDRAVEIFNEFSPTSKTFEISISGEELTATPAAFAVIAAIGEMSAELFGLICKNCHFPNPKIAKFCMNCGTKLTD